MIAFHHKFYYTDGSLQKILNRKKGVPMLKPYIINFIEKLKQIYRYRITSIFFLYFSSMQYVNVLFVYCI